MLPRDSSRSVPLDQQFQVWFSKSMHRDSLQQHFCLQDTFNNSVKGDLFFENGSHVRFKPTQALQSNTIYRLVLPAAAVCDAAGNRLADTLFVKKVRTVLTDTLSELSGTISDADSLAHGWFYIEAHTSGQIAPLVQKVQTGPYRFQSLLPGRYTLRSYRDQDDNGQYTYGEPFPFKPAERYYIYPDTLDIRSRWPNEGNDIQLPKP
jgi:hypothetical protein